MKNYDTSIYFEENLNKKGPIEIGHFSSEDVLCAGAFYKGLKMENIIQEMTS